MKWIIVILLNLSLLLAKGQHLEVYKQRPHAYNKLGNETIFGLCQTPNGYVYIGTNQGLFRYNGISYEPIKTGTKGKAVNNLIAHGNDLFCMTFSKELVVLKGDSVLVLDDNDLALEKTSGLRLINDTLFILNKKGIIGLNPNTLKVVYELKSSKKSAVTWDLYEDANGVPKVLHDDFNIDDLKGIKSFESNKGDGNNHVHKCQPRFVSFNHKQLAINLKDNRFYNVANNQFEPLNWNTDYLTHQKIHKLHVFQDSLLLISAYNGLFIVNENGNLVEHLFQGTPTSDMITDQEGNIWVGTLNDGLYMLPDLYSHTIDVSFELSKKDKINKALISDNQIILGTHQGWIFKYDFKKDSWNKIKLSRDAEVQAIYQHNDTLYAYCDNIFRLNKNLELIDSLHVTATKEFLKLSEGLYMATSSSLLFQNNKGQITRLFESQWIRSLSITSDSSQIIANTDAGYHMLNRKTLSSTFTEDIKKYKVDIPSSKALYLKQDVLWLEGENEDKIVPLSFIPTDYFIHHNYIFAYNNNQIETLALDNLNSTSTWTTGFELLNKNLIHCSINNNHLIAVFEDAIQFLKPKKNVASSQPNVIIKNIKERDIELHYQGSINLTMDVLPSANDRGLTKVYFRIDGIQDTWSEALQLDNGYLLNIERLPSGSHSLMIKATNRFGVDSEVVKLNVSVAYPFWQKYWFIMLIVLCVVSISWLFQRLRVNQIKKKNKKEMRIKRLEIQSLNAKLEALRSQMNPHFIFNTINTIQSQIMTQQSDNAYDSLNTFAKLIRAALEHSTKNFVSLKEDQDFIDNYLKLEALRFDGALDYSIYTDPKLEGINPKVPSLLVQPFIENGIKHGLLHKSSGDKKLKVRYTQCEDNLLIEIEDNGVGRSAAAEINRKNEKSRHKSYATRAIDDRIKMLNDLDNLDLEIVTEDLQTGTRVTIKSKMK